MKFMNITKLKSAILFFPKGFVFDRFIRFSSKTSQISSVNIEFSKEV